MSADIGRLAFSVAGVIGGFIIGGPIGASIGLAIGSGLGFLIFPPEGKTIEGPRLDDLKVSFSSYGRPIPRIYGTMETGGNVVWSPGLIEHRTEEEVGGKGAPSITQVSFLYTASFRIVYADASPNPAQAILRNWADGKLIRDLTGSGPTQNFFDTEGPGNQAVRDFFGGPTQLPGPAEQADKGVANTPAYRFLVSQEWEDMALEDFGNRIPQVTAEVAMFASDNFPKTSITGTDLTGFFEWQIKGETFVIHNGSRDFTKVDNLSQSVAVASTLLVITDPSFPCVDKDGNFYRVQNEVHGPEGHVEKFDGKTLQLLQTGAQLLDPFDGSDFFESPSFPRWVNGRIFGLEKQLLFVTQAGGFKNTLIIDIDALGGDTGGVINTYFAPQVYSASITVDSSGNLWVFYTSGSDTVLTRVSPGFGDAVDVATISGETFEDISYEPITNSLILGDSAGTLIRFGIDSLTIEARLDGVTYSSATSLNPFWNGPSEEGRMYLNTAFFDTIITEFDVINMVTTGRTWNVNTDFFLSSQRGHIYDPVRHAVITSPSGGTNLNWLMLDRMAGTDVTVRSIVEDVSLLVDYIAGTDIDATALTDTLPGYVVKTRITARKALEPLATAFNFRSVESDFKIKFPKRGGASIGNIPQIDLGATAGEVPTTQALSKTRTAEDQLFETAVIEYIDPTFDNNPNTQQAKRIREAIDVGGSVIFNFPGALGNNQAKQIIERILFQAWSGRTNISTSVPLKHILKDPGDVITLTKDGKTVQLELHDVKLGANSIIKISGTVDDSAVHVSTATGTSTLGDEGQVIILTGPTEFFILDIPLLRDIDDGDIIYVAAGTSGNLTWPGVSIRRGVSPSSLLAFTAISPSRDMDFGFANGVLANGDPDIWDRTNTLNIHLFSGVLSSDTEINVLNGANPLLIGDEVVQFTTAVLESDGTYTISTLLRGKRGTEGFNGTHVVGERIIVLSASTVLRVGVNLSDHLTTFFYRAITLGDSQFSSKTVEQVLRLRSQMPYAPSHVAGTRPANNWIFTHLRRTRIGGAWRDLVDVPLGETSENYEWDVMDGTTVKRTLTSVVESVTYTEADQITDFGSVQDSVELNVYQLSDTVGRGFATNITIEV